MGSFVLMSQARMRSFALFDFPDRKPENGSRQKWHRPHGTENDVRRERGPFDAVYERWFSRFGIQPVQESFAKGNSQK